MLNIFAYQYLPIIPETKNPTNVGFRLGWKLSFGLLCGEWGITLEAQIPYAHRVYPTNLYPILGNIWIEMINFETKSPTVK